MRSKDKRFLRTAQAFARIWSKDPSTKVGAVAVGETPNIVAFGYNGFPPGIEDSTERLNDRNEKYHLTLHAEVNALANATFPVRTLYVTHHPCANCALHILAARTIERVVYMIDEDYESRWKESIQRARELLREGCIQLEGWRSSHNDS